LNLGAKIIPSLVHLGSLAVPALGWRSARERSYPQGPNSANKEHILSLLSGCCGRVLVLPPPLTKLHPLDCRAAQSGPAFFFSGTNPRQIGLSCGT
jgi:hypothetical protein